MLEIDAPPTFTEEEVYKTVRWLNDMQLMRYSGQRLRQHTIETQLEYINSFKSPSEYIRITCNDVYIGTMTSYVDVVNQVSDVGILIGKEHTGHGHGCEAMRILCNRLGTLGIRKIEGGCMAKNTAMIRIFEKNHFRLEGTRKSHFWDTDGGCDLVLYGRIM